MNVDIDTVMKWNLGELYNYIKTIQDDLTPKENETLNKTEKGKHIIPIHINYYIKEYYEEFPKSQKVKITGLGKVDIEVFWEDLNQRETSIRKIIIDHMKEDSITEGRI